MKRHLSAVVLLLLALPLVAFAPDKKEAAEKPEPMKLKVGDTAPDFTLLAFNGTGLQKISLHDYRGKKNVALAFYVFAFTGG